MAQADFARHAEAIKEAIAREESRAADVPAAPAAAGRLGRRPRRRPRLPAPEYRRRAAGRRCRDAASGEPPRRCRCCRAADEHPGEQAPRHARRRPAEPGAGCGGAPRASERILFGESDDLLADVDTGVNENEFKW